jgi:hypothetical protein
MDQSAAPVALLEDSATCAPFRCHRWLRRSSPVLLNDTVLVISASGSFHTCPRHSAHSLRSPTEKWYCKGKVGCFHSRVDGAGFAAQPEPVIHTSAFQTQQYKQDDKQSTTPSFFNGNNTKQNRREMKSVHTTHHVLNTSVPPGLTNLTA